MVLHVCTYSTEPFDTDTSAWAEVTLVENGTAKLCLVSTSFVQRKHTFLNSTKLYLANLPLRAQCCYIRSSINKRVFFSNSAESKYNAKHASGYNRWGKARDSETVLVNIKSTSHCVIRWIFFEVNIATFPNAQQCTEGLQGRCRTWKVNHNRDQFRFS